MLKKVTNNFLMMIRTSRFYSFCPINLFINHQNSLTMRKSHRGKRKTEINQIFYFSKIYSVSSTYNENQIRKLSLFFFYKFSKI